jgi:hypothetical protein
MVVKVDDYTPPPGRNMAHYLAMDVDRAGGDDVAVTDALQRYLDVRPSRGPRVDPKDVGSHADHPSLILEEDQAWADAAPYRFSVNGMVQRQSQPTFYTRAGSLKIRLVGRGVSTVSTPATEPAPSMPAGPFPAGAYYPPEVAAQLTMRRITDMLSSRGSGQVLTVGPDLESSPSEALSGDARRSLEGLSALPSGNAISERVREGLNKFANLGIYKSSPQLYLTAMAAKA